MAFMPMSSAPNEDAQRQANANAFFFTFGNILEGIDDALTMEPSTKRNGLLGPTETLGVDIGIGSNGEVFLRGTAQASGPTAAQAAQASSPRVSPMVLLVLAAVAFVILNK